MADPLTDEEVAVIDLIQRENFAFWMRDEATFAACHANRPDTLRWGYLQGRGLFRRQGTGSIVTAALKHMRGLGRPVPEFANAPIANIVIHVAQDMAWVYYDRLMPFLPDMLGSGPSGTIHQLAILERIEGAWLIVATTLLDSHLGDEVMVRVAADGKVLWSSTLATARLLDDPAFVIRNGRLRLRQSKLDARLRSAMAWAAGLGGPLMPRRGAIPLVIETAQGGTRVSWIVAEDLGSCLVMLDDIRPTKETIGPAAQVFGLSPAQTRIAAAICEGRSLVEIATASGMSTNTARTHLRRVFEKTGVSNQSALVATLLSLTPPR